MSSWRDTVGTIPSVIHKLNRCLCQQKSDFLLRLKNSGPTHFKRYVTTNCNNFPLVFLPAPSYLGFEFPSKIRTQIALIPTNLSLVKEYPNNQATDGQLFGIDI